MKSPAQASDLKRAEISVEIQRQPDNFTCGPTCLQAIYQYYKDPFPLERIIKEVPRLENGGTLAVLLGCHALSRGYRAKCFTYNLHVFDPTWFDLAPPDLLGRLTAQERRTGDPRVRASSQAYRRFVELGGELRFEDLTKSLIRKYLNRSIPILTGLSSTYLYRTPRERDPDMEYDDLRGLPVGHFVLLCGYDRDRREVTIADPQSPNPLSENAQYRINIDRVICAILLGIITHDANLLIIEPREDRKASRHAHSHRRE